MLGVAFSPDGKLLAAAGADRTLRVYQTADGKELTRLKQFAEAVTGVAFNRTGTSVAASNKDHLRAKVFDPPDGETPGGLCRPSVARVRGRFRPRWGEGLHSR